MFFYIDKSFVLGEVTFEIERTRHIKKNRKVPKYIFRRQGVKSILILKLILFLVKMHTYDAICDKEDLIELISSLDDYFTVWENLLGTIDNDFVDESPFKTVKNMLKLPFKLTK